MSYRDLVGGSWRGFVVPVGTPKEMVERLHAVAVQVMATPDVVTRLATGGAGPLTSAGPAAFAEYVAQETRRWARIGRESNATPDSRGSRPRVARVGPGLGGAVVVPLLQQTGA